ncbi:MAG: peptidylprolyl isomerase [bacterium]
MSFLSRVIRTSFLLAVCLLSLLVANCGGKSQPSIDGDLVLARFNNDTITAREVVAIIVERNQYDNLLLHRAQGKTADTISETLEGIAYRKAVASLARKEGLDQTDSFRAWKIEIVNKKLGQLVLDIDTNMKIRVSDDDVDRYYRDNPSKFAEPETYTFRGIVSLDKSRGREGAREHLTEALKRLDAGEDFVEVAEQYSDSPEHLRGKLQGPRTPGGAGTPLEVEEAILSLATGEYSRIIELPKAVAIYQLVDRTQAKEKERTPLLQLQTRSEIFQERRSREEQILVERLVQSNALIYRPELMNDPSIPEDTVALEVRGFPPMTIADIKKEVVAFDRMTTTERSNWFINRASSLLLLPEAHRRGYTEDDVAPRVEYWEGFELVSSYLRFLLRDEEYTGDELREYYDQHTSEFVKEEKYELYRIYISAGLHEDMSRFQQNLAFDQAQAKADEVYRRITTEGLAFQDAAREYSSDPVTAQAGGYVGLVSLSELGIDFYTLFEFESHTKLEPGLITPPRIAKEHQDHLGYDIYYCAEVEPSRQLSFVESVPSIARRMAEAERDRQQSALRERIAQDCPLVVNDKAIEQLAQNLEEIRTSFPSDSELLKALLPRSRLKELLR